MRGSWMGWLLVSLLVAPAALAAPTRSAPKPTARPSARPLPMQRPVTPAAANETTGLVLDVRGLDFAPCMSPRLSDEAGQNLLEGLKFDPDRVVSEGFASWVRAYNPAELASRIGPRPLVLQPIKADGDLLTFSVEDAARLRTPALRARVLEPMRIVIVY